MAKKRKNRAGRKPGCFHSFHGWMVPFLAGVLIASALLTGSRSTDQTRNLLEELGDYARNTMEILDNFLYGKNESKIHKNDRNRMQVDVIDVGEGNSILLTAGTTAILIDAGEGDSSTAVLDHLRERGIEKLDLAIGTNARSDRIGGMEAILEHIPVEELWLGPVPEALSPDGPEYGDLLLLAAQESIPVRKPIAGTQFPLDGGVLTVLGPVDRKAETLDDCSLVCRVDFGEAGFLFGSDAGEAEEKSILAAGRSLKADVMTIGHHGGGPSPGKAYLKAISPRYAAISCGPEGRYGSPSRETIRLLKNADALYRRTDISGTIVFTTDGCHIEMHGER